MSFIGEAIGFARSAEEIEERLRSDKTLTSEQRIELEKRRSWYEAQMHACRAGAESESWADDNYGHDDDCCDEEDEEDKEGEP